MFDVLLVQPHWPRSMEQMGTKRKFWYENDRGELWLFKYARPGIGEDWAEKIAEYLCSHLGLPHARYELAEYRGERGVASQMFRVPGEQLLLGNQLLGTIDPEYLRLRRPGYGNTIHTVDNVLDALKPVDPPRRWTLPDGVATAQEVFVGYLLLDAVIGNIDRHDENWGVVAEASGAQLSLAPTFDHASSLGRELDDAKRLVRLTTRDRGQSVAACAGRALSGLYATRDATKAMTTFAAFERAAQRLPGAA